MDVLALAVHAAAHLARIGTDLTQLDTLEVAWHIPGAGVGYAWVDVVSSRRTVALVPAS